MKVVSWMDEYLEAGLASLLLAVIVTAIGGGITVFCVAAWLLKIPEWQKMTGMLKRSLNRS